MSIAADHSTTPGAVLIDRTALKVNQAAIITLLLIAFIGNLTWLVAFVAAVMVAGTISPQLAVFQRLYHAVLKPAGWLTPDLHREEAAPHRFAQGLGGAVLVGATLALVAGLGLVGWTLSLVVVVLAAINLGFGFCAGCFVYLHLSRLRGEG